MYRQQHIPGHVLHMQYGKEEYFAYQEMIKTILLFTKALDTAQGLDCVDGTAVIISMLIFLEFLLRLIPKAC